MRAENLVGGVFHGPAKSSMARFAAAVASPQAMSSE
jgi:hypothetical protein